MDLFAEVNVDEDLSTLVDVEENLDIDIGDACIDDSVSVFHPKPTFNREDDMLTPAAVVGNLRIMKELMYVSSLSYTTTVHLLRSVTKHSVIPEEIGLPPFDTRFYANELWRNTIGSRVYPDFVEGVFLAAANAGYRYRMPQIFIDEISNRELRSEEDKEIVSVLFDTPVKIEESPRRRQFAEEELQFASPTPLSPKRRSLFA